MRFLLAQATYLKRILSKTGATFWIFLGLLFVILTNQVHFLYPDELENVLGGHYILNGRLPYIGFFTHHNPGAYVLSAVISLFTGVSFVKFRIILGFVYLIFYLSFYWYILKRFGQSQAKLLVIFYTFITFGATYFWGQMLLADSLSAYLLAPAYIVIMLLILKQEPLLMKDLLIISTLAFFTIFTTMTQTYACFLIYIGLLALNLQHKKIPWIKFFIAVLSPFFIFFLYLLLTGSIVEYYRQAVQFNALYYIRLPDNVSAHNPIRVAIVFLVKFFQNFKTALFLVKDLSFGAPFVHTLVLSNAALIVYFIVKRRFTALIWLWFFLSFINARGNPYTTSETDYQSIVYHFVSIFNGLIAVYLLWKEVTKPKDIHLKSDNQLNNIENYKKTLLNIFIVFLGVYQASLMVLFFDRWLDKSYQKFMGIQPLIYDRPSIAPLLNRFINSEEYYYIGPFDFENQLYMKSKLPTKYIVILPGMDNSQRIQNEILADIKNHRPKIIVFNSEKSLYQAYPGKFFLNYLNDEYVTLESMGMPCNGFKSNQKWFDDYDFERHFFLDKNQKDQLWEKFLTDGLIYKADPKEIDEIPMCIELKKKQQKTL